MSNSIMKYEPTSLDDLQRTAKLLAASGYFDAKGSPEMAIAQIATKIMAGSEMGYGPFASVQGIHVIQGKPALSANLMAAAVKGHPRYDYRVRQMDDTSVSVEFFESGQSLGTSTFTIEDARRAKTQNLDKFPRNMLFARAMSNGVRWFCPDVFNGNTVYTPEEFDIDSESIRVVDESTGEILPTQTTTKMQHSNSNGNTKPQPTTNGTAQDANNRFGVLNALGMAFYGNKEDWDAKRKTLSAHYNVTSSKDLTDEQINSLIVGLEKRTREIIMELGTPDAETIMKCTAYKENPGVATLDEAHGVGLSKVLLGVKARQRAELDTITTADAEPLAA